MGDQTLPTESDLVHPKYKAALEIRNAAMERLGITPDAFARHVCGMNGLSKDPKRVQDRATLWRAMRAHPSKPSYQAIAAVCGVTTHAHVYAAINGSKKKLKKNAVG